MVYLSPNVFIIETEDYFMKKIIAVLLSVLMLFSVFGATVYAAEGDYYTVKFVDFDGTELGSRQVIHGGIISAPENPSRENTEEVEYIFKGWSSDEGKTVYSANTLPLATADVTYTAVYAENEVGNYQTFWGFVKSIFERINMIFEYFYKIFEEMK